MNGVSEAEAAIIAEDAQCNEDYFVMADHLDANGEQCKGVGKSPESLVEPVTNWTDDDGGALMPGEVEDGPDDDGDYLESGDIPDDITTDHGKMSQEKILGFFNGPLDALNEYDP